MNKPTPCSFRGCDKDARSNKLCIGHYWQMHRGEDLRPLRGTHEHYRRQFWSKVDKSGECWIWTGAKRSSGYGLHYRMSGGTYSAHRISYELHKGAIPEGLEIDHLCFTPACVRPDHLEAVDHATNMARMAEGNRRRKSNAA